ncbi:unnamed protein product, partial [Prorocentrum cordatum]
APGRLLAPTVAPLSAQPTRRVPLRRRELPPRRSHGAGPGPHGVAQPRRPRAAGLPRAPRRLSGFRGCAEAAVRRLRGGPRADGVRAQGHRRGRGGGAPQLVRVRGPPGGRVLGGGEAAHRGGAGGRVSSRPLGAGGGGAVSRTTGTRGPAKTSQEGVLLLAVWARARVMPPHPPPPSVRPLRA